MEYIIVDENPEEPVKMCNTNNVVELINYFGLSHYTILRVNNGKIEWAHWTYEGVEWLEPEKIIERMNKFINLSKE